VIALTHNLFVGKQEDLVWMDDLRWANTGIEAAQLIERGYAALLPEKEGWEAQVRDALVLLGASEDHIEWCFRWQRRVNERSYR
jgi:hypothetical protein